MSGAEPILNDALIARLVADAATVALHFVGVDLDSDEALIALGAVRDKAHAALLEFMPPELMKRRTCRLLGAAE
jgi:hypothetical protein